MSARASIAQAPKASSKHRLGRKKIYILPTRHGLAFAGVLVVMLAGAINYNNSLAYALTFLLTSLALSSMLHTYRNLAGLSLSGRAGEAVFAGTPIQFQINIDNRSGPARQGVLVRENLHRDEPVVSVELPANSRQRATLSVPTLKRGWQHLEKVTIASRAPFGIFRAWSPVQLNLQALVYPAPDGNQPLPAAQSSRQHEQGWDGLGRDDFAGLREYQVGDSPKRIHWKAAARGNSVPLKLFEGANRGELMLSITAVMAAQREARLSQLSAWVMDAESKDIKYGLELGSIVIAPDNGSQHQRQCLKQLALFELPRSKP
jgi:uncharacterized protein (DUF58 family)